MSAMNAFYAQSGGVTAVINASACGVIETARKHTNKIATNMAARLVQKRRASAIQLEMVVGDEGLLKGACFHQVTINRGI